MTRFDGSTYNFMRDGERLSSQLVRVRSLMADGNWRTLAEIAEGSSASEAAASARLRDLRKGRFGGFRVDRRYLERGLWQYRVLPPERPETLLQTRAFDAPELVT